MMTFGQFPMLRQPQISIETLALHPNDEEDDPNVMAPPSHIFVVNRHFSIQITYGPGLASYSMIPWFGMPQTLVM